MIWNGPSGNRFFDCERNAKSDFNSHPYPGPLHELREPSPLPDRMGFQFPHDPHPALSRHPPHEPREPTPHPDPLPSHPMGAERESVFGALRRDRQQADADRVLGKNGPTTGSAVQCVNILDSGKSLPLPQAREDDPHPALSRHPPHEPRGPTPHPDPLPSHPMGAERE